MSQRHYNIIGYRKAWYLISGSILALCIIAFSLWGLKLGIDFTGGSLVELKFEKSRPSIEELSGVLPESFGTVHITPVGTNGASLRLKSLTQEEHQTLLKSFQDKYGATEVMEQRFTSVGPVVGEELQRKSIYAIIVVLTAIVLYIAWAFRKISKPVPSWQYGLAAIVALFHDVFLPIGVFAVLGHFWGVEVDTLFITALLTVLGFSIHDTIVVFDRIREHLLHPTGTFSGLVNQSVNETLARSVNTSITTLLVLISTLIFGGESIRYFVFTLCLGIIFGTYSSIFIAPPLLVSWNNWQEKRRQ